MKINHAVTDKLENKVLAKFPSLINNTHKINYKFGIQFEDYLKDRFTFKKYIVKYVSSVISLGNNKIDSTKAFAGKDNWLFYKLAREINNYANIPISDQEQNLIYTKLTTIKHYLNNKGIKFYFFIGPDKNRIYREFYPSHINILYKEDNLERLVKSLHEKGFNNVIYPLRPMLKYKKTSKDLLYYKTDTHWNALGGYIGYQALIKKIQYDFPQVKPLNKGDYKITHAKEYRTGDLAKMLQLKSKDFQDIHYPIFYFNNKVNIKDKNKYIDTFSHKKSINPLVNNHLKVLMFRDSYTIALVPFLSRTFHEIHYIWDPNNIPKYKKEIDSIKPDIVIFEQVGRDAILSAGHMFSDF